MCVFRRPTSTNLSRFYWVCRLKPCILTDPAKTMATSKTGETNRAPDCSLGAGEMDVVSGILLLRLCFFSICFNE